MPELIDISPLINPDIAVWPGDVPFSQQFACRLADGANIDLSSITTTVHVGAHCDAPSHYRFGGKSIAERSLDFYFGSCQVIRVSLPAGERIYPHHLQCEIQAPRLLLCTNSFPDPNFFNKDFNSLSPELIDFAHQHGVCLIGLDTPSVDPFASKKLESHQAIADRDMAVIEGVVLKHVADGVYTLIALPLKLAGGDASPVRAVLMR